MDAANLNAEVKSWLEIILAKENLQNFSVTIPENSEKSGGHIGDVIFVHVDGTDNKGLKKEYDLVVKCSKSSEALQKSSEIFNQAFPREIFVYEQLFPCFKQFQLHRGVENLFDCIPKYYGSYSNGTKSVIVLENLRTLGYEMWDISKPQTRQHLDLVVKEYAKLHAISVAMKEQEPEKFSGLVNEIKHDIFKQFFETAGFVPLMEDTVEELYHLLKTETDEYTLKKWIGLKDSVRSICLEMNPSDEDLQVIVHGDCWNNNYVYKYQDENKSNVSKVTILDWQITKYFTPVLDLSYFLFCCIAGEEVCNLNNILKTYHNLLLDYSTRLGCKSLNNYTFERFYEEWKKYSRFGVVMCMIPIKLAHTDKSIKQDMAQTAESGEDVSKTFVFDVNDMPGFINRIKPIVEHAVKFELI